MVRKKSKILVFILLLQRFKETFSVRSAPTRQNQFTDRGYYSGFRRKARVIKCNRFPRQKGGHGPRRSMRRLRKLGTRNTTLLACDRKFWQLVSRHKRSSRIQRCRSFSERVGPRIIFFKASQVSSCSKRSRGITTEPIACGFCCYFRS